MRKAVLVTGGAGYIGSHTCLALIREGWRPVVMDTFANSSPEAISRLRSLTGSDIPVCQVDIRDTEACRQVMSQYHCQSVIHFAGLKAVGESQAHALEYYDVNVNGTHSLLKAMTCEGVRHIIFSSSATVYGEPTKLPISEDHPLDPTNPYGRTKLTAEKLIEDVASSSADICFGILRYFNPVGADQSGKIGEDPKGQPNNLMPFIAQVAVGRREYLTVYGDDYSTKDGTGVRDYIHVSDLAIAHLRALEKLVGFDENFVVNLGTGRGYSVLEVLDAFSSVSGRSIPHRFNERRVGDVATVYADPTLARNLLGWKAELGLKEMCRDHWLWQEANPLGYDGEH